jgi:hypothetical protein
MSLARKIATCLALALLAWPAYSKAATTDTLQDLANTGGSLSIGDKVFSNFDFLASGLTSFDPSQIVVTASFSGGVYYLTWSGNMSLVSGGTETADLLLGYTVTATNGLISEVDQSYTGSAQPSGGAFLAIDETIRDINGNVVGTSHVDGTKLTDIAGINPPQSTLNVTKDIGFGIVDGGFVTISQVSQSFRQVPEPGTAAMLIVGSTMLGVAAFRRRKRV